MSDEEEDTLKRDQIDPLYLAHYLESLRQIKAHVSGRSDTVPFSPSFILPTGCWTSGEKDAFFHGLSVYSRLRPDLIADGIKTKSIADVCNYLEVLEDAIVAGEEGVPRKAFPGAMVVTPHWIEFEEKKAMEILAAEEDWDDDVMKESREEEVAGKKKTLWGKTQSDFKPWEKEQRRRWENEDFCKSLASHDLTALNAIIRAAEANVIPQPDSRASSQSRQSTVPRDTSAPPLTLASSTFDESLIDPALMVQSGNSPQPTHVSIALPPVSFANAPLILSPSPGSSITPADLSPASRRRLTKRLYMRRKRAKETGREVDDGVGRLKPGRKAKKSRRIAAAESTGADGEQQDDETSFRHPNPSGMTLPYKVLTKFRNAGIDAEVFSELGLDLFHLPSMSKLMNLHAFAHEQGSELGTSISQQTIKLFRAHVVRFLTDLMHRVIIVREQELSLKSHTKVWKVSNAVVTKENVETALGMMDPRAVGKEQYFARLIEELNSEKVSENEEMDVNDENTGMSSRPSKSLAGSQSASPPVQLLPHCKIYTPFVRLPFSLNTEEQSLLSDETDEDQLIDELLEEEELDKMDGMLDEMHQKGLWERFRDSRPNTSFLSMKLAEWDNDEEYENEKALYQPSDDVDEEGRERQIKSKAYISDSDYSERS